MGDEVEGNRAEKGLLRGGGMMKEGFFGGTEGGEAVEGGEMMILPPLMVTRRCFGCRADAFSNRPNLPPNHLFSRIAHATVFPINPSFSLLFD